MGGEEGLKPLENIPDERQKTQENFKFNNNF